MANSAIAPRPAVNQGILTNHPLVTRHARIYADLLSSVTPEYTLNGGPGLVKDPYGTAPLSAVATLWSNAVNDTLTINVVDVNSAHKPVRYQYKPVMGANLVPITGLCPSTDNIITITSTSGDSATLYQLTQRLPQVNVAVEVGFLNINTKIRYGLQFWDELYFTSHWGRYNIGYDGTGTVRWYTDTTIPSYNIARLSDGTFLSTDGTHDVLQQMYRFDITGRIMAVYQLDNEFHHSIIELRNNQIMATSEYSGNTLRPGEQPQESTNEDGTAIVDLNTGLEVAYYDFIKVLDRNRAPVPTFPPALPFDWLHVNQSYMDYKNNLVITSARHQSCLFGVTADSNELRFICGTHEGWSSKYSRYLLTPVNSAGAKLYDLNTQEGIDKANREFWSWGQHNCSEVPNTEPGIVDMLVFDNGNFRSRDVSKALLPTQNFSRVVRYRIDLNRMTVRIVFEYGAGANQIGARGYSSFVCSAQITSRGTLFVNSGGILHRSGSQPETLQPGFSDIIDPNNATSVQGFILQQEVEMSTKRVLMETWLDSGAARSEATDGPRWKFDVNCFRALKLPILTNYDVAQSK